MTTKLSFCVQAVSTLQQQDLDLVTDNIERYMDAGLEAKQAESLAVRDALASLADERKGIEDLVAQQYPKAPVQKSNSRQTGSAAFKAWFGDSKTVDAEGNPLVLFTGTSKDVDFTKFKVPKNGAWFTTDPASASDYAKDNDSKGLKYNPDTRRYDEVNSASRVMPVYLRALNPAALSDEDRQTMRLATNYRKAQGLIFDRLRAQGFDSVDFGDGVWVALAGPEQIKSAIGNDGSFSPKNPDIRRSKSRSADAEILANNGQATVPPEARTANFKRWSGGAPVVMADYTIDYEGGPAVFQVFSGTTFNNIEEINPEPATGNKGGWLGRGFYTSTSVDDVNANYAGIGPDLKARLEEETEQISGGMYDDPYLTADIIDDYLEANPKEKARQAKVLGLDADFDVRDLESDVLDTLRDNVGEDAARAAAEARLKGESDGLVMPLWVKTQKPFDMRPGGLQLDYDYDFDEEIGDYTEPVGPGVEMIEALNEVAQEYGVEVDNMAEFIREGGYSAYNLFRKAGQVLGGLSDPDTGEMISAGQFMQEVARRAGYDAIIMDAYDAFGPGRFRDGMKGVGDSTLHIMPFKPNQVKSAVGNSGEFSDTDVLIVKSNPRENYDTDLFGVPTDGGGAEAASPKQRTRRALSRDDAPGRYATTTSIVSDTSRTLGTNRVVTVEDAAQALAYLHKSAVERFDALITDSKGKPLAVVGAFKGALAEAQIYPSVLASEAFRIDGAANIWFAHNHPSGTPTLSRADLMLNQTLAEIFRGSEIKPQGIFAFGGATGTGRSWNFQSEDMAQGVQFGQTSAPVKPAKVPVAERVLDAEGKLGPKITGPDQAKAIVKDLSQGQSGVLLTDVQFNPLAFVPVSADMAGRLRGDGRMDTLWRAISKSNAGAAFIANSGDYDDKQALNLAGFFGASGVRLLDVVETSSAPMRSWVETGKNLAATTFLSTSRQTDTPAFKKWFGDSKVVDAEGEPLEVYHGSDKAGFTEFDTEGKGKTRGTGAFFTSDFRMASGYQKGRIKDAPLFTPQQMFDDPEQIDGLEINEGVLVEKQVSSRGGMQLAWYRDEDEAREDLGYEPEDDIEARPGYQMFTPQGDEVVGTKAEILEALADIRIEPQPGVYSAFLKVEDMLEIDWKGNNWDDGPKQTVWEIFDDGDIVDTAYTEQDRDDILARNPRYTAQQEERAEYESTDDAARQAREMDYDGVKIKNVTDTGPYGYSEEGDVYVVFDPTNIKSANANNGNFDGTDPDIRRSPTRNGGYSADQERVIGDIFAEAQADRPLGQRLRDNVQAIKSEGGARVVQAIFDRFAAIKTLDAGAYVKARMVSAAPQAVLSLVEFGGIQRTADGALLSKFDKTNSLRSIAKLLEGEMDPFLKWFAAFRAERLLAEGRENLMDASDIKVLKSLGDGKMASGTQRDLVYREAARRLMTLNESVLKVAMQRGLLSKDEYLAFRDQPYVPFYRELDGEIKKPNSASALTNQIGYRTLKGGTSKLNGNLAENVLNNWAYLLLASAKNEAAVETLKAAEAQGIASQVKSDVRGAVRVKVDGKSVFYEVDDKPLLRAVSSFYYATPDWLKGVAAFKRVLTNAVTWTPGFKINNLIADSIQGMATSELNTNPLKNLAQGMQGAKFGESVSNLMTALKGDVPESLMPDDRDFADMLTSGALLHFSNSTSASGIDELAQYIKAAQGTTVRLNNANAKELASRVGGYLSTLVDAYAAASDASEQANRIALYKQLRAKGRSSLEAAFAARDLMDFSLSGGNVFLNHLVQVVPFMNARLQGLYKLGRGAKADPAKFATIAGYGTALSLALFLAYKDDEDWKKRTDQDRDTNFWFKIGDTAFTIRKPFELGSIMSVAERTWELMEDAGEKDTAWKRYSSSVGRMLLDTLALDPTPQIIKPFRDIYANKDAFTGRAIENQGDLAVARAERYNDRTSEIAKLFGQAGVVPDLGALLMEGELKALSPKQLDFLMRGYLGATASVVNTVVDGTVRTLSGDERPSVPASQTLRKLTGINNFKELPSETSRYVDAIYSRAEKLEQQHAAYNRAKSVGDTEKMAQILDNSPRLLQQYTQVSRVKRQMSAIQKLIRQTSAAEGMDGDAKREAITKLRARLNDLAQQAEAQFEQL